jgi:dienelactone hydrolase
MRLFLICCAAFLLLTPPLCQAQTAGGIAQNQARSAPAVVRVEASPDRGFDYPYYLYAPPELHAEKGEGVKATILVVPNNTGKIDDDFSVHDAAARRQAEDLRGLASELKVALLVPAFPRPKTDWRIYTHALDRDSLLTDKKEYRRFDLQVIRMIDDARARLRGVGLRADRRVLMLGFSAAGMFTNRFAFLHPDRIKAAAAGSPGGWAIAPVETWEGKPLRYPVGVADFKAVSGRPLDMKALKRVPLFLFLGGDDTNDSVIYRDSYEKEDEELIFSLFGRTLQARWEFTKTVYGEMLPEATLKLYPKVGHSFSLAIWADIKAFFLSHLRN